MYLKKKDPRQLNGHPQGGGSPKVLWEISMLIEQHVSLSHITSECDKLRPPLKCTFSSGQVPT